LFDSFGTLIKRGVAMANVQSVTTNNFENEVLNSDVPVLVDFWATWCPPCKMLAPVLDRVAATYSGQVKIVKCDTDENSDLALQYGVSTIPNVMFFKGGQVVDQSVGYVSEAQLSQKIDNVLAR
jgi:thioredoxin 1